MIKDIKARAKAATPGLWDVLTAGTWEQADADFLAHARTDIDYLLAQLEAARDEVKSLMTMPLNERIDVLAATLRAAEEKLEARDKTIKEVVEDVASLGFAEHFTPEQVLGVVQVHIEAIVEGGE